MDDPFTHHSAADEGLHASALYPVEKSDAVLRPHATGGAAGRVGGRSLLLAGVAVAALALAGAVVAIALNPRSDGAGASAQLQSASPAASAGTAPTSAPTSAAGASASPVGTAPADGLTPTLTLGQCVLDPYLDAYREGDGVWQFPGFRVVPCGEPHFGEVYVVTESVVTAYDDWALYMEADDVCWGAYEGFVGTAFDDSTLFYEAYYPSEATWAQGDRAVMCMITDQGGEITGSVAGSGR